jgi:hypothetical protein
VIYDVVALYLYFYDVDINVFTIPAAPKREKTLRKLLERVRVFNSKKSGTIPSTN